MNKFLIVALFFVSLELPALAEARNISVLFVGNSYTYYNDMPQMVVQIAAGDPAGGFTIDAKSATIGGKTLAVLWKDANIQKTFTSQKWDDVVLQEQSEWALFPANIEQAAASIPVWSRAIKATGAKPLLYVTWARQPGSYWYTDREHAAATHDPKYMQQQLDSNSAAIAAQNGVGLVPVGDAFALAQLAEQGMPLYAEDSSHPSVLGSYLAALMMYQSLTGRPATATTFAPLSVTPVTAETLRQVAAKTAQK